MQRTSQRTQDLHFKHEYELHGNGEVGNRTRDLWHSRRALTRGSNSLFKIYLIIIYIISLFIYSHLLSVSNISKQQVSTKPVHPSQQVFNNITIPSAIYILMISHYPLYIYLFFSLLSLDIQVGLPSNLNKFPQTSIMVAFQWHYNSGHIL